MAAESPDPLDELVRLQVLQLRRSLPSQAETIIELGKAGFANARIAALLGTTTATVKVTIQRSKKTAVKAKSGDH